MAIVSFVCGHANKTEEFSWMTTGPVSMMETAYEDKLLNVGFVFTSLWRQQLGDGSDTDELMVTFIIFSKICQVLL